MVYKLTIFPIFFFPVSHFEPFPIKGASPWSQRIIPSLLGTRLAFRCRWLGQRSRTASTVLQQTELTPLDLLTYARFRRRESDTSKKNSAHLAGIETHYFSGLMVIVGPLDHRAAA